jgi:hypothetical protein
VSIAFLDLEKIATNLTILEGKLFLAIKRKELLGNKWSGKYKTTDAPNICKARDLFRFLVLFLDEVVVRAPNILNFSILG